MTTPTAGPATRPRELDDRDLAADEALAAATTELHLDTAGALCRLPSAWGDRLLPSHPHYSLISRLTRDLVNAGLPIHDCDARERTGGVCLTPSSTGRRRHRHLDHSHRPRRRRRALRPARRPDPADELRPRRRPVRPRVADRIVRPGRSEHRHRPRPSAAAAGGAS